MALLLDETGRLHVEAELMVESPMDEELPQSSEVARVFWPLHDLNVIKLGGRASAITDVGQ